ncbi:Sulfhydryl oxidase [Operophtera brumata]|uniref:Sulfhydryl oxidase n=1 Tax=Operophtera brumata TaxID=104452 RepID=A0A0L7L7X2_OPEBR|nr:Sulfhydryl oxidase [Operophtera brumata]
MPPSHGGEEEEKPCKACSDFKSWTKTQNKNTLASPNKPTPQKSNDCPLDKQELGNSTWGFLHTMASYFPDKPSKSQSEDMSRFFNIFAQFYPCEPCALDFKEE